MTAKKNWTEEERKAAQRDYYAKNRERKRATNDAWRKANPDKEKNTYLKSRYGITLEQYEHMFTECNGTCMICNEHGDTSKDLFVDHNHDTGDIRGLLCYQCNFALGHFKDSIPLLLKAVEYLTNKPYYPVDNLLRKPRNRENKTGRIVD